MAATMLTPGAISKIFNETERITRPVVQLLEFKATNSTEKKIKIKISDGSHYGIGVLTSGPATLLLSDTVVQNQFLTLTEFTVAATGSAGKMCIVMDMVPVPIAEDATPEKIGEPIKWDSADAAAAAVTVKPEVAEQSASPKPGPGTTTPQTGNISSRTAAFPKPPVSQLPQQPLVGARAAPIDSLNPYSNKWLIKARVTAKSDMRTFSSARGDGCFFHVDLADDSGEIKATAWGGNGRNEADRLYPQLEVGNTYLIARGQLKVANKKFSTLNNDYEITFTADTQLQLCTDEPPAKPKVHYRFVPIAEIANRPKDASVDVLGVVTAVGMPQSLTSQRTGKDLTKRLLTLADDSGKSIELTMWGQNAESCALEEHAVVAFKGVRVSEWNQRSLGTGFSTTYEVQPENELAACERLKAWWEGGGSSSLESLSQDVRAGGGAGGAKHDGTRATTREFAERGEAMGASEEPLYASVRAYYSKHLGGGAAGGEERPLWYPSCPKCEKKVVGDEASGHNCENCGWSGMECSYRYIVPIVVVDADGSTVLTAFNNQATSLLGIKADELKRIKDTDHGRFESILSRAQWKAHLFRVRGKMDTYGGTTRLKGQVLSSAPVKWAEEGKLLLADIQKYGDLE